MTAPSSPTLRSATAVCRRPRGARSQERHLPLRRPLPRCSRAVPRAVGGARRARERGQLRGTLAEAVRGRPRAGLGFSWPREPPPVWPWRPAGAADGDGAGWGAKEIRGREKSTHTTRPVRVPGAPGGNGAAQAGSRRGPHVRAGDSGCARPTPPHPGVRLLVNLVAGPSGDRASSRPSLTRCPPRHVPASGRVPVTHRPELPPLCPPRRAPQLVSSHNVQRAGHGHGHGRRHRHRARAGAEARVGTRVQAEEAARPLGVASRPRPGSPSA